MTKLPKLKRGQIVVVEWWDAASGHHGWYDIKQARLEASRSRIATAGFVLNITRKKLVMVLNVCAGSKTVCEDICIPRSCIIQMEILRDVA